MLPLIPAHSRIAPLWRWALALAASGAETGTFEAFLEAASRDAIVLVELEPSFNISGFTADGTYPNVYSMAFPRFVLTDAIKGGVYREVIGVRILGVDYTERGSLTLVNDLAGSYWPDEANELLYVH